MAAGVASTFDWGAFFGMMSTVIVAIGVPWVQARLRAAEHLIKKNTEITEENAARSKAIIEEVRQIALQTDGMSKHLEAVARREGILEGIAGADQAAAAADQAARIAAVSVAGKLKALDDAGDYADGTLQDASAELQVLIDGLRAERKRKNIGKPP